MFRRGEIVQDHRYFIAGSLAKPAAIMALDNKVKTNLVFWTEVQMTSENLKTLIVRMETDTGGDDPYGSKILDKDRNVIGYWYSTVRSTIIKFSDKGVSVYSPDEDGIGGGSAGYLGTANNVPPQTNQNAEEGVSSPPAKTTSAIDECIAACKKYTSRTDEECFDNCNK
jgi:hypothetical protein